MLNMESASAGASLAGLSKTLTTPFSINDILTRSQPARRISDPEHDLELQVSNKSCCRDLNLYKLAQEQATSAQQSSYLQFYALDNNNPASSSSSNSAANSTSASLQRKLSYFGAALSAATGPLDMRRCTSNDSGKSTPLLANGLHYRLVCY